MTARKSIQVPLLDLKAQYETIRQPVREAIDEVCDSQWFVMGPNVKKLEEEIAEYSQCDHGVGVSSGTDALLVALMALGIGRGDAVVTTPYTFFATGGTIARLGATPVFCDIDPVSYNIDPAAVRKTLEEDCEFVDGQLVHISTGDKVRCLMPVHLYGQTADMDPLVDIAESFGLAIVEDAAQSIGSEYLNGKRAGSEGTIGCFSFFPSKNLGAFGDGGMCTTNDETLAERLGCLRLHGGKPKYFHAMVGGNFRLDAIQAAILLVKLKHLDDWTARRQANADHYTDRFEAAGLSDKLTVPTVTTGSRHIYNQYVIRVDKRDQLRAFLAEANIGTEIYYPVPLHLQKCFAYLGYSEGDCPEAESAAKETLAVPVYPEVSSEQIQYVVDTIAEFYS